MLLWKYLNFRQRRFVLTDAVWLFWSIIRSVSFRRQPQECLYSGLGNGPGDPTRVFSTRRKFNFEPKTRSGFSNSQPGNLPETRPFAEPCLHRYETMGSTAFHNLNRKNLKVPWANGKWANSKTIFELFSKLQTPRNLQRNFAIFLGIMQKFRKLRMKI